MSEEIQNTKRALVLRDAQGTFSWVEIGAKTDISAIVMAREKQGYSVFDTTTVERAKKLVTSPAPGLDDFSQFRR